MIASSTDEVARPLRVRPGLALGLARLLLAPAMLMAANGVASAQNAPISLLPQSQPKIQAAPPASGNPAPAAGAVSTTAPAAKPINPLDQKVEVQGLGSLDPSAVGLLDEGHGGLPHGMWAGTDAATVSAVLPIAGLDTTSRATQSLLRRLLLSAAAPPDGKAEGPPLVELRARRLWAMGDLDALTALFKVLPSSALTPEVRRLHADTALLTGDSAGACSEAQPLAALMPNDPYPVELRIFCQFNAGKGSEASLGIDVLREQKVSDPAFFLVADALSGTPPGNRLEPLANPTPVVLAMARLAKLPEPPPAPAASPAVLRSIALIAGAPLDVRLIAAERAEAVGALDTDILRRLYESVPFTAQELADPPAKMKGDEPRSRAQLYQASLHADAPAAKAAIIGEALSASDGGPRYFGQARLYAPQIAALRPGPELASFAPVAVRALFAAQKVDAAAAWSGWLRAQAATDKNAAEADAALWALARLAKPDGDTPLRDGWENWRKVNGDLANARARRRAEIVLGLLAALGEPVPAEAWVPLYAGPAAVPAETPRAAFTLGLDEAMAKKSVGGTVLFVVAMLGEGNLAAIDPADLCRAVAALDAAGLDGDARALAVEAALAYGV